MEPEVIEGYFDSIESPMYFSSPVDSSLLNVDDNSNSEQQNKDPSASVLVPASDCGPEKFFQFLTAALQLLEPNYQDIVDNIDLALLEGKIKDIYNQIWHFSGSKGCPKYMKEENGRLMKLCQLLFPGNVEKRIIRLDAKKKTTLFFVMACMRIQSFKGRRARDPSISVEAFKEMLLRKMQELTAEDIIERMVKLIPFNIKKYYCLDIKETGCAEIRPKHDYQCFDNLDRAEDFANFMEQNKNKTSDSKKRKREPNPKTTGKPNSRKSRRTTVDTTPRKGRDYVPIICSATPPACPPRQVNCEDSFERTLMASLHRLKATNAEQYLNTVARLTSIAQSGLQQNGMGDASILLFAEDPFNGMPDPQHLSMQQQQGHYQDQPQIEGAQQIQPDCVGNVTYTLVPNHSVPYMLPQAPLALHDSYDAPLSPLVSRMLLGELNNVTNEIGIGESSGCQSPEQGPDVQSSSFELDADEMGAMDFYPFVSGEEVHRTSHNDDLSLDPVPYSQCQVSQYLKV